MGNRGAKNGCYRCVGACLATRAYVTVMSVTKVHSVHNATHWQDARTPSEGLDSRRRSVTIHEEDPVPLGAGGVARVPGQPAAIGRAAGLASIRSIAVRAMCCG
jgi:hypothetical protein